MASNITFDTKEFMKKAAELAGRMTDTAKSALFEVGGEIMRLSSFEVPHDEGLLMNSGAVEPSGDEVLVGYNKVYAARLHEHPEYKFQKGRKGKYLEDPIKNNMKVLLNYLGDRLKGAIA